MLSINIPVYQIEISTLVYDLVKQGKKLNVPFEIRVYDDCSNAEIRKQNHIIKKYPEVVYTELDKNIGRSAIRNKMGMESKFEFLLFIDADSKIINENYLSKFIEYAKPNQIICGGTAYNNKPPEEPEKLLRWYYGINREAISAEVRNSKKGFIITSNNFLIERSVFKKNHFREEVKKYGHEDTLLGYDLYRSGVEIVHIDNKVEHTGLEDSVVFLEKTRNALKNLYFIENYLLKGEKQFVQQVHFLNRYYTITKYIPEVLLLHAFKCCGSFMEKNLTGKNPNLSLFDLYKTCYFATLINANKNRQ